ncbi:uncharacterized protein UV8b_04838 [Ustilaginoidea virens]|uniref:Uncharacterized protein n=1 Tax=Ustilaginoidea virens TaxID=1159556 RepID=A0A8E5MI37_USTVR|nr:uncharacterized protein UV8b_04838 [Ustilaginoidea virens]QUC20597.1 hypothetical protein UV8b_04838 [Ustilaginoidea virens]
MPRTRCSLFDPMTTLPDSIQCRGSPDARNRSRLRGQGFLFADSTCCLLPAATWHSLLTQNQDPDGFPLLCSGTYQTPTLATGAQTLRFSFSYQQETGAETPAAQCTKFQKLKHASRFRRRVATFHQFTHRITWE